MAKQATVLVVGGTGKTGRRVAERLAARGVPVRLGSRSATPAFDWEDRATWRPALAGTDAAYVSFYPDVSLPGAAEAVGELARLAVSVGVRRLVLLSGRGEEGAVAAEEALIGSGAEWTVLRASWFAQNFCEGAFAPLVAAGEVALPAGAVREPFVDVDDIADVAVAALVEPGHAGRLYELTGPRALTFADAVSEIARATGRAIRYRSIGLGEFEAALAAEQVPADVIALLRYLFSEVLDGRNTVVVDGVERALGRPPRDFSDYARAAAARGVWGGAGS